MPHSITDRVCMAIATGQLAPGDALPSVRGVAERLVVNPNPAARADPLVWEALRDGTEIFEGEREMVER